MQKLVTIGVYGFNREGFFQALQNADVDLFCDIRLRRGVRGSEYSFVNSQQLQSTLATLNIRYLHLKNLAPTQEVRDKQKKEDERLGIAKRSRQTLGQTFIHEYKKTCLAHFNTTDFMDTVGPHVTTVALFCVEKYPEACHRSLVSSCLAQDTGVSVEHLMPPVVS